MPSSSHYDLADAADENLALHASWATASLAGARVTLEPDLVLVDSGLPCDTFNLVCRARLRPELASRRIQDALAFFAPSSHPFSWWLGPGASPEDLPQRLADAGLQAAGNLLDETEHFLPQRLADAGLQAAETEEAMALALVDLAPQPPGPRGLEIRQVRTLEDLTRYATLSAGSWTPPDPNVTRYYRLAADPLLSEHAPRRLYLGLLEGQPVATAELTVGADTVGLYNVATEPPWRRRGIGTAMAWAPLWYAREAGYRRAILQATGAAARLYATLGFRAFGLITEFKPGV